MVPWSQLSFQTVWVDVADEGQMWITTVYTFSFFREIESYSDALQTKEL